MGNVYVIGPQDGPYKIGIAANPAKRLINLQTANHAKLMLHYEVETHIASEIEHACHGFLYDDRLSGEWFGSDIDLIKKTIERALLGERPPKRVVVIEDGIESNFNLKAWRESNGYSKVQLAKELGLSRWTIARMEEDCPRYIELACKGLFVFGALEAE